MPESQSEYDIRMLRFRVQNLEKLLQSTASELRDALARIEARLAAPEEPAGTTVKPSRRGRANSRPREPGLDGI